MSDPKQGEDIGLEQWANAILAEDAKANDEKMPDYRRRFGLIQRRELEVISVDPDVLGIMVQNGGKKIL